VKDVKYSVYEGLTALPWPNSYLTAMWIVCHELRPQYADWIHADEIPLMDSTMDLVRDVALTGELARVKKQAAKLASAWGRALKLRRAEPGLPGGVLNALAAFEGLAQEIAGISGRYDGANWATNAVADRWETWDEPGPIIVDFNEEIDDDSPMAQTMARFQRIVTQVSVAAGPGQDPAEIRARILG
jgi:hypothetical protein